MEDTPNNEQGGTPSASEPAGGKPKPPPRPPRTRRRGIRLDRVWRARFLLTCGAVAGIAVLAMLARPTGEPHKEAALVPGGEIGTARTVSGTPLYRTAGCEAPAVQDDEGGRQLGGAGGSAPSQTPGRSPPPAAPTLVAVGFFIVEVTEVDEVDNTFTIEVFMDNVWCDPNRPIRERSTEPYIEADAEKRLERGWNPNITFVDEVEKPIKENQELTLFPSGTVEYKQKFNVTLENRYDLRRFPFDHQTLRIELESFDWTINQLELRREADKVAFSEEFEIPEWRAVAVDSYIEPQKEARDREKFSELVVTLEVDRESGFYVWKILVPLILLVAISWSVFWMSGESLAARIGILFTGILAVVAYQFVINTVLPKVTYFTLWDTLLLLSFVLMALTVAVNVLQAVLRIRGRAEQANEIDATARVAFPVTYVAGLAPSSALEHR
jgi:Neurotransmitter-gated ion-channel ligand binding domain